MSRGLTAERYMRKAERALQSAHVLLRENDTEGACNRAYYAMFDAAHAALCASGGLTASAQTKTHSGLLSLFSKELVLTGRLDATLSKALHQAQTMRLRADYTAELPSHEGACWAVAQAEAFLKAVRDGLPSEDEAS